jgi:hypothetical protein
MIFNNNNGVDNIHCTDLEKGGIRREITYVYHQGLMVWELIIGFIFDKLGRALSDKNGLILKAKDQ